MIHADTMAIGVGAFAGAMARYQAGRYASEYIARDPKRLGHLTGWHTAAINVSGSFLLGGLAAIPLLNNHSSSSSKNSAGTSLNAIGLTPRAKLMLGVGFISSYTTFSTYSVDIVTWASNGQIGKAAAYVMINNVGSIAAAAAGMVVVKKLIGV